LNKVLKRIKNIILIMKTRVIIALLICLLISFYLELSWLVLLLAVSLFLMGLTTIQREKPKTVKVKKEPDVIYPVIYEDVGKPPLLYPEKMNIKIEPKAHEYTSAWEDAFSGLGNLIKVGLKLLTGKKK